MFKIWHIFLFLIILGVQGRMNDYLQESALNVRVEVPPYVKAGDTAVLKCLYDIGSETLYTVKWYKGRKEFFRYTPKESPPIKSFSIVGLQIDVSFQTHTITITQPIPFNFSFFFQLTFFSTFYIAIYPWRELPFPLLVCSCPLYYFFARKNI